MSKGVSQPDLLSPACLRRGLTSILSTTTGTAPIPLVSSHLISYSSRVITIIITWTSIVIEYIFVVLLQQGCHVPSAILAHSSYCCGVPAARSWWDLTWTLQQKASRITWPDSSNWNLTLQHNIYRSVSEHFWRIVAGKMKASISILLWCATVVWSGLLQSVVDAQGSWQTVVNNAGIASMHTAVTHYGNVVLLDRTNIGPSQLPATKCRDNPADLVSVNRL